jgi:hypothetical protein
MYECGKLKKVIGNKILFRVILEQCDPVKYTLKLKFDMNNALQIDR